MSTQGCNQKGFQVAWTPPPPSKEYIRNFTPSLKPTPGRNFKLLGQPPAPPPPPNSALPTPLPPTMNTYAQWRIQGVRGFKPPRNFFLFACQFENSYGPAFSRTLAPLKEFLDLPLTFQTYTYKTTRDLNDHIVTALTDQYRGSIEGVGGGRNPLPPHLGPRIDQ